MFTPVRSPYKIGLIIIRQKADETSIRINLIDKIYVQKSLLVHPQVDPKLTSLLVFSRLSSIKVLDFYRRRSLLNFNVSWPWQIDRQYIFFQKNLERRRPEGCPKCAKSFKFKFKKFEKVLPDIFKDKIFPKWYKYEEFFFRFTKKTFGTIATP